MGGFTSALMLAGTAMSAYGQYRSGQDAQAAAEYNAAIYQRQASVIDVKKGLTAQQWDRKIRQLEGKSITAVAASGYDLSGSFLEVMNDTLTQAQLDKQTEIYNLDVEKSVALSSADEEKRSGARARTSANIKAVSTVLTGGNDWYQQYGGFGKTEPKKG